MGLYTPDAVTPITDVRSWEQPGDTHPEPKLLELRSQVHQGDDSFVWVGLFEPTKAELDMVARVFEIPPLQIEDAANPEQRPKFEIDDDGHGLAVLKVLDYEDATSDVRTGQVSVFVGEGFALTIRFGRTADL
ncbi:MAG TPA: magnesium transporter CorA, partial [Actinobacteria bacterium]|nr:magnesium transporter CorA [Actinomycetota bacterium]